VHAIGSTERNLLHQTSRLDSAAAARRVRLQTASAAAAFAFAIAIAVLRVGVFTEVAGIRFGAGWAMLDFDTGGYYPVRALLSGENPYDRERFLTLYPVSDGFPPYAPFTLLFHLPFGLLPHTVAEILYGLFTIGLMVVLAWMALRATRCDTKVATVIMLAAALLLTRPGHWNLVLGQRAALFAVGSYLALFHASRAPWLSAAGITLTMLKPTWGVPLLLLMLARGDLRPVALGVLLTLAANLPLLALIVSRAGGVGIFGEQLLKGYRVWQDLPDVNPATSSVRIDAATTVSRFVGHPLGDASQILLTVLVITVGAVGVRLLRNSRTPGGHDLTIGIICTAVLLCGYHLGYDFLLLTVPMLTVLVHGLPTSTNPWMRWLFIGLFAIPALNWISTESVLAALQPNKRLWLVIASLNGVALTALFCCYLWFAVRWRLSAAGAHQSSARGRSHPLGSLGLRS
jgi:Glycosyltransferase family 87